MNSEEARLLAVEHFSREGGGGISLEAQDLPPPGVYGFDPEGWETFRVIERDVFRVGGDKYVAVNLTTKEVRPLGIIGE